MKSIVYRILCIDPALSVCGWSILEFKIEHGKPRIIVIRSGCIKSSSEAIKVANRDIVDIYGKQLISLSILRDGITKIIEDFHPTYVVIEDAFYNPKRPSAFASLLQCICTISLLCKDRFNLPVFRIPTRAAKQSISGGSATKIDIIKAILESIYITFKQKKNSESLTEHEADSIALGYHFITTILPGLSIDSPIS